MQKYQHNISVIKSMTAHLESIPPDVSIISFVHLLYPQPCQPNLLAKLQACDDADLVAYQEATRQLYTKAMQRFASEIQAPLERIWRNYDDVAKTFNQCAQVEPEQCCLELVQLSSRITLLSDAAARLVPFCLGTDDVSHPVKFLPLAFRQGHAVHQLLDKLASQTTKRLLQIPSAQFNALLPLHLQANLQVEYKPPKECSICRQAAPVQVNFCRGVCRQNSVCYGCLRRYAWSVQQDDDDELRPMPCPFCVAPLDLHQLDLCATLYTTKRPLEASRRAKRRKN